jgi:hypothetical protein
LIDIEKKAVSGAAARDAAGRGSRGKERNLMHPKISRCRVIAVAHLVLLFLATLVLLVSAVPSASAGTVTNERPLLFTFDGADTSPGRFVAPDGIAVDNASGAVYVGDNGMGGHALCKFSPDGGAENFVATGIACVFGVSAEGAPCGSPPTESTPCESPFGSILRVAVDNSGCEDAECEGEQGRLYVSQLGDTLLYAFAPSGELLWTLKPGLPGFTIIDVAVDVVGRPWLTPSFALPSKGPIEYDNTGTPPTPTGCTVATGSTSAIDVDASGNVYVGRSGGIRKYTPLEHQNESGCTFAESTFDSTATDVYVDQSSATGHVFTTVPDRNELQKITVSATAGQFRLKFSGESTSDIAFDAPAKESEEVAGGPQSVEAALKSIASIGPDGVTVFPLAPDSSGRRYFVSFEGPLAATDVEELSCEDGTEPLSGGSGCAITMLSTGGHGDFQEYDSSDTPLGTYGTDYIDHGRSVAYNPALDRVYVALRDETRPVVAAFGPAASGTVPDATVNPPTEVKASCAHFSGTVNPQGVTSKWRFEWRVPGQSWAAGGFPPKGGFGAEEGPLPVDSTPHEVEYDTCALSGNTIFQVRLVGINREGNAEDGLRSFSEVKEFTTPIPKPPVIEECSISAITTGSAHLACQIDPEEDTTKWRVETQQSCEGAWTIAEPLPEAVPFEGTLGPVPVSYDLTGLLPAERYCVRVWAKNGNPEATTTTAEDFVNKEDYFETEAVPPTEAETSFAAPRLDTSARLNARINPQGAPLTYRFEYRTDGGGSWQELKDETDASEAREQIVVGQELTGLTPNTPYSYRLATASNAAGPEEDVTLPGETRSFTTRTSTELTLPAPRGYELVNNPDKGNQNVVPNVLGGVLASITQDGEKALWKVTSGSPGGNTATGDTFLAQRTPSGWKSETLIPPPAQQLGGGSWGYLAGTATPDFSKFVFVTGPVDVFLKPEVFVRLDTAQHEEALTSPAVLVHTGEMSDDGAHVVLFSPAKGQLNKGQLKDVGTPGKPMLLSIMPDGTESECFELENTFEDGNRGTGVSYRRGYRRIATADASRAYFEVQANLATKGGKCEGPFGLYQRNREANNGKGHTTLIDPGAAGQEVEMIRATPDGRSVYFTTHSSCRKWVQGQAHAPFACETPEPADIKADADIYRWEEASGESSCLTCEAHNEAGEAIEDAAVRAGSAVMVSDDFSHVYFESERQLVPGQGKAGEGNLYTLSGGVIRFVADLDSSAVQGELSADFGLARLSADGNMLVFSTVETNVPSRTLTADAVAADATTQLYRYDDRDRSIECVSCLRGGNTTHNFGGREGPNRGLAGDFGVSSDGSTIIFPTAEPLVPRDVNKGFDVYEWRNGVQRLISDGVSDFGDDPISSPHVAGVDADGSDIFFTVVAPGLTGYEQDGLANLYDARIGGGFLPPSPPIHCTQDSCQGPLLPAPALEQPASQNESRGNVREGRPCPKGKHRRHGRCVKPPHKRSRHHKRASHGKRGRAK